MAILFVCMYVCMFICHQPTAVSAHASRATRKRSRPCLFRSLRSPTNALHSPSIIIIIIIIIITVVAVRATCEGYTPHNCRWA